MVKKLFSPKSHIFNSLFLEVATTTHKMSTILLAFVAEADTAKRTNLFNQIEELERVNDKTTNQIFSGLAKSFITPFDREDIHFLANSLDDISDHIYEAAKKIGIYRLNPAEDAGIKKMAELLHLCTIQIENAVAELHNTEKPKVINEAILQINILENKADELLDELTDDLFNRENDLKEIIKRKDIYQSLETATDKCEDAATAMETIIVKYS